MRRICICADMYGSLRIDLQLRSVWKKKNDQYFIWNERVFTCTCQSVRFISSKQKTHTHTHTHIHYWIRNEKNQNSRFLVIWFDTDIINANNHLIFLFQSYTLYLVLITLKPWNLYSTLKYLSIVSIFFYFGGDFLFRLTLFLGDGVDFSLRLPPFDDIVVRASISILFWLIDSFTTTLQNEMREWNDSK